MPRSSPRYSTSNPGSCQCVPWEAADNGSGTWAPATYLRDLALAGPALTVADIWGLNLWMEDLSPSVSLSLSNKMNIKKTKMNVQCSVRETIKLLHSMPFPKLGFFLRRVFLYFSNTRIPRFPPIK